MFYNPYRSISSHHTHQLRYLKQVIWASFRGDPKGNVFLLVCVTKYNYVICYCSYVTIISPHKVVIWLWTANVYHWVLKRRDEQITYPFPNIVFTQAEEEAASHETFSSNCDSENNLSFPISRELLPSNLLPHSNLRYKWFYSTKPLNTNNKNQWNQLYNIQAF